MCVRACTMPSVNQLVLAPEAPLGCNQSSSPQTPPPPDKAPPLCLCPHLHDAVLSTCHQQLPVCSQAAAVRCVLEATDGAPHLTAETIVQNHLHMTIGRNTNQPSDDLLKGPSKPST